MAVIALERGDLEAGSQFLEQMMSLGARNPDLLYNFGLVLQKKGRFEDAARLFGDMVTSTEFAEFLTLRAYDYIS